MAFPFFTGPWCSSKNQYMSKFKAWTPNGFSRSVGYWFVLFVSNCSVCCHLLHTNCARPVWDGNQTIIRFVETKIQCAGEARKSWVLEKVFPSQHLRAVVLTGLFLCKMTKRNWGWCNMIKFTDVYSRSFFHPSVILEVHRTNWCSA